MKATLLFFVLSGLLCFRGLAQEDPLVKNNNGMFKVKSKEEMAAGEAKLTGKGKAAFEKAKNDFKNVKDAKFELAPNEQLNQDESELLGLPKNSKPDPKLANDQNEENRKNQKEMLDKMAASGIQSTVTDVVAAVTTSVPAGCTWRTSICTPVKNQRSCGSCWAFASVAAIEHGLAYFKGVKLDLSEEDVLNCGVTCNGYNCGSCNGGWSDAAFDFMKCKGIAPESVYPYTGTEAACLNKPKSNFVTSWGQLYPGRFPTVAEVKSFVNSFGSVVTYMKAGIGTFFGYGGGVYNGYPSSYTNEIDHAVLIVGWCDYLNAWIIKNSWGTGWGPYGGFAYVGYNQCNIGKYVYWVFPRL
jgi:C1A family cysteine protease